MLEPWCSGNFNHSETGQKPDDRTHLLSLPCIPLSSDSSLLGPVGSEQSLRKLMWSPEGSCLLCIWEKTEGTQPDSDRAISICLTCSW